jgi:hypothetical protein
VVELVRARFSHTQHIVHVMDHLHLMMMRVMLIVLLSLAQTMLIVLLLLVLMLHLLHLLLLLLLLLCVILRYAFEDLLPRRVWRGRGPARTRGVPLSLVLRLGEALQHLIMQLLFPSLKVVVEVFIQVYLRLLVGARYNSPLGKFLCVLDVELLIESFLLVKFLRGNFPQGKFCVPDDAIELAVFVEAALALAAIVCVEVRLLLLDKLILLQVLYRILCLICIIRSGSPPVFLFTQLRILPGFLLCGRTCGNIFIDLKELLLSAATL